MTASCGGCCFTRSGPNRGRHVHELALNWISGAFQERAGRRGTAWIWSAAQPRVQCGREGEQRSTGVEAVFGAVVSEGPETEALLRFHFPPLLLPLLQNPQRFARVRTHILLSLSGNIRPRSTSCWNQSSLSPGRIGPHRSWTSRAGCISRRTLVWHDLKRWVLDPALKQLNHRPDERAIHAVHFAVQKTAPRPVSPWRGGWRSRRAGSCCRRRSMPRPGRVCWMRIFTRSRGNGKIRDGPQHLGRRRIPGVCEGGD